MTTETLGFEFPLDTAQQWDGFNDPGIEHFSGNPFEYLGREVTQNTIDAIIGPPAQIRVRFVEVPTESVPDIAGLRKAMEACALGAADESVKAKTFFDEAVELLKKPKLGVLQIADYNTTGVVGPCENGRPYFALMKATGQSRKSSGTAAGSFGIGKFAPYTASLLRTVFITTAFKASSGSIQHYCQGKSILMSHEIDGKTHHGTGYWGVTEKCMPLIGNLDALPDWLRRADLAIAPEGQLGTTLNVLGFAGRKGWQQLLAANIAENFFGAICKGHLEVTIEGGASITEATLPSLLTDPDLIKALNDQKGEPEKIESRHAYLRALTSNEKKVEHTQNEKLGNCELHILVAEGLPKRVAFLRNGMMITDELAKLRRFGDFKEFAAVVECHSAKGNALLRAMEPPRHDDFEPERLPTDKDRRVAKIALREITSWVREMLGRHAKDPVSEVTNLDEMAEFFGDPDGDNGKKGLEEDPQGRLNIRARPIKRGRPLASFPVEAESGDDDFGQTGDEPSPVVTDLQGETTGGGGKPTDNPKDPTGNSGFKSGANTPAMTVAALANVRAVPLGARHRRVAFTAGGTCSLNIELQDFGADSNRQLRVVSSSIGTVKDGKIVGVPAKANERVTLEIEFGADFGGTVRVLAYAV